MPGLCSVADFFNKGRAAFYSSTQDKIVSVQSSGRDLRDSVCGEGFIKVLTF